MFDESPSDRRSVLSECMNISSYHLPARIAVRNMNIDTRILHMLGEL